MKYLLKYLYTGQKIKRLQFIYQKWYNQSKDSTSKNSFFLKNTSFWKKNSMFTSVYPYLCTCLDDWSRFNEVHFFCIDLMFVILLSPSSCFLLRCCFHTLIYIHFKSIRFGHDLQWHKRIQYMHLNWFWCTWR